MKKSTDIVFNTLQQLFENCPRNSYGRLNGALYSTLRACIAADLPFQRDTFERIYRQLRGHYWFGDGAGSHAGEGFYNLAIACNHASAIQSFEAFANRPGVLWEENDNTPERLHVGKQFTWQGYYVTVTSMRADSLVACTYKDAKNRCDGIDVGATISDYRLRDNKHFVITSQKRTGKGYTLRVLPTTGDSGSSSVAKRFTIPYAEIEAFRRTENQRAKVIVDAITKLNPTKPKEIERINQRVNAGKFRHFQLEKFKAAWSKRKEFFKEEIARIEAAKKLAAWRKGAGGTVRDPGAPRQLQDRPALRGLRRQMSLLRLLQALVEITKNNKSVQLRNLIEELKKRPVPTAIMFKTHPVEWAKIAKDSCFIVGKDNLTNFEILADRIQREGQLQ